MEIPKVMFDSWHASVHVFFSEVLHQETVQGEFSHFSKVVEGNMERQLSPDTSLGQILLFMTWETQLRKYAFLNTTTTDTKGSVQFSSLSHVRLFATHGLQHARPPCPSPTRRVYPNSSPLSRWCHPTISSSVVRFSSCPQSFPTSGSFQMSQFFASGGQSIIVSASASKLDKNTAMVII